MPLEPLRLCILLPDFTGCPSRMFIKFLGFPLVSTRGLGFSLIWGLSVSLAGLPDCCDDSSFFCTFLSVPLS